MKPIRLDAGLGNVATVLTGKQEAFLDHVTIRQHDGPGTFAVEFSPENGKVLVVVKADNEAAAKIKAQILVEDMASRLGS